MCVRSGNHRTSTWSGGTTTELAIFPPCASYADRDFEWRMSTAVVTAAKSTFTSLPGYRRLLMVLEGQMQLEHAGHHEAMLRPFEQDCFSGSWLTTCTGTGQDFNLMLAAGWQGSLQVLRLAENDVTSVKRLTDTSDVFFCLSGQVELQLPDGSVSMLQPGDMFLLPPEDASHKLELTASGRVDLVHACVWRG